MVSKAARRLETAAIWYYRLSVIATDSDLSPPCLVVVFPSMTLADEKQAFSRRLKEAMRKARVDIGKPTLIAREFNLRYHGDPVSTQAVRKWLSGKSLPAQDKVRALGLWLEVSAPWLRFGEPDRKEERSTPAVRQETASYRLDQGWISRKFEQLSDRHKRIVLEIVHALLRLEGKQ